MENPANLMENSIIISFLKPPQSYIYQDYFQVLIANVFKTNTWPNENEIQDNFVELQIKTWKWMWNSLTKMLCNALQRPNLRL